MIVSLITVSMLVPGWVLGQFSAKLPGNWVILGSLRNKKAGPFGAAALQGRGDRGNLGYFFEKYLGYSRVQL